MKAIKKKIALSSILLAIFVVLMSIPFAFSAKKFNFLNSSVVPAAKGYVKVKQDNNKNYIINVEVTDLAEGDRVQASKTTYVVWMETDKGNAENLGQSSGFFSKRHTASLQTVSSFRPAKMFITTEEGINVRYPGRQVALASGYFEISSGRIPSFTWQTEG